MSSIYQGFQDTRQMTDVADLFRWLDLADGHELIQDIKRRMLEVRPAHEGERVLDVGCGLGHEVRRWAQRLGPRGRVVGVDQSEPMIAQARRRGTESPVEYLVGDARRLELADDSFDLCRAERVLRYIEQPEQALREMARVVRPGGEVVVFDFDSDHTIVDAPDPALTRRIAEVLDAAVPNPWMGRQLPRLFRQVGLTEVTVVPHVLILTSPQHLPIYRRLVAGPLDRAVAAGQIGASDVARWWDLVQQADRGGAFFAATLGCIVRGRKPDPRGD